MACYLAGGGDLYVGPLADLAAHRRMACSWGGSLPQNCVMMAIRIGQRLVSVLYGDGGERGLPRFDIQALERLTQLASKALELYILRRRVH